MYYTIEGSNAWGATTFLAANYKWTFKREEALRFYTWEDARNAQKLFGMGRIEAYKE